MRKEGRTIIFVSHDTNAVKRMCGTAVLLERGEVLFQGPPNDVTNVYTKLITSPHGVEGIRGDIEALKNQEPSAPVPEPEAAANPAPLLTASLDGGGSGAELLVEERAHQQISDKEYAYGGEQGRIASVLLTDDAGQPCLSFVAGSHIRVRLTCSATAEIQEPIYALTLKDVRGQEIYGNNTYFQNQTPATVAAGASVEVLFSLQLNVQPGVYFISLGWVRLVNAEVQVIHRRYDVLRFDVLPRDRSFGLAHCPTTIQVTPLRTA